MSEAARRAVRQSIPNLRFVVAAAEQPPPALVRRADLVTVYFPWGSLLRGLLGVDERVAAGVARLLRPGADVIALVSVEPRDGVPPLHVPTVAAAWRRHEVELLDVTPVDTAEIRATRSTWGRRLLTDPTRRTVRLTFRAH